MVFFHRRRGRFGEEISLTFDTTPSRTKHGWAAFWARDPFVQAHRTRKGFAFGTYEVPGGEGIATHLASSDIHQHTLILGATGTGKSSLLELFARSHLQNERPLRARGPARGSLYAGRGVGARNQAEAPSCCSTSPVPTSLPSWNPLLAFPGVDAARQVDMLVSVFKRLYADEVAGKLGVGTEDRGADPLCAARPASRARLR